MKIMIVDDELIIRQGLTTVIDWKELGLELLPAAASAEEAIVRIPVEKPQIVITDIRMYDMNGIELANRVKTMLPHCEIIILSGYDDFTYAQQALRENVADYILKTSPPEEIIQATLKAKQRITAAREAWRHETAQLATLRQYELESLLTEQVYEQSSYESTLAWMADNGVLAHVDETAQPHPIGVVIIAAHGWGEELSDLLHSAVENMVRELLDQVGFVKENRLVIVMAARNAGTSFDPLERAVRLIEETLKCSVFAAIGGLVESYTQLPQSYREAEEVFAYRVLMEDGGLYRYEAIQDRRGGRTVCSQEEEEELANILIDNDQLRLRQWVNRLIGEKKQDPEATPDALAAFVHSMMIAGHRWFERVKGIQHQQEAVATLASRRTAAGADAETDVYELLLSTMAAYHEWIASSHYSHVRKAIGYIRTRLDTAITLQEVAGFVHLHPSHFSEIFKKETGLSYVEYVTRERMQLAMHYLKTSDMKISEIAGRVGYKDIKYFGQQFKKYTGKTPSEYQSSPSSEL